MPTLQELEKAMMEQRRGSAIMQQRALESMENQDRYNTTRFSGLLPGLIETVVDKIQKKRTAPEHQAALRNAVDHASGLEELEAKYQAMVAEQELAEKQKAAEGVYTPEEARALSYGIKLPEQPTPETTPNLIKSLNAAGIDPRSPEGRKIIEQSLVKGQTAYNITIPTGYRPTDPQNPAAGFTVIPGSPQELEARAAQEAEQKGTESRAYTATGVLSAIDRALENVGPTTAGWGSLAADIPATAAKTLQGDLSTVQANLAFDRLQKMRDESKTGGALGQVSNIELDLLKNTWASVQQAQSPEELRKRLKLVRQHYQNFTDALNGKMPAGYDEQGNPAAGGSEGEGAVYQNPQTGEKIRWNGQTWVVVP